MAEEVVKFVTDVVPQLTPDQLKDLIESLFLELKNLDQESYDESADDLREEQMKIIQKDILDIVPPIKGMTQQTILDNCLELHHSYLDTKGQLEVLVSEGKVIINKYGLYSRS